MAKAKPKSKSSSISFWLVIGVVVGLAAVAFLMFYKLGSIMPGITVSEKAFYNAPLGWHGIYKDPLNLPMNILWSLVFKLMSPVGIFLLRAPAALTGGLTIIAFYALLQLWYGTRTAVFGSILFATSAWTLHVSRIADYNVEYLAAIVFFMLSTAILQKRYESKYTYWLINLAWSLLLYVPGMVILIAYNLYRQRKEVAFGMTKQTSLLAKSAYVVSGLIWIPLLLRFFIRAPKNVLLWLGLPSSYDSPLHIIKEFGSVFYHIFARGPLLPGLWLGRMPLLDIFGIITALVGIYFYITHIKATRTHLLFVSFIVGVVLIALGGAVTISFVIPIIYVFVAAGVAYLLSQWLSIFPENPVARSMGYILISLAVAASVIYNVRSYFVAWPHNTTSVSVFDVNDKDWRLSLHSK
ncbi:MAG: hypothetical protein WDN66_02695 [Candidatus Saccharibacteria bacterium]